MESSEAALLLINPDNNPDKKLKGFNFSHTLISRRHRAAVNLYDELYTFLFFWDNFSGSLNFLASISEAGCNKNVCFIELEF